MKKILLLVILISILPIGGCSKNGQLSLEDKIEDFNYMYSVLKENYPYFQVNKRKNNIDWLSNKGKYINKIKSTRDDQEYFEVLQSILKDLNNGHAAVMDSNTYFGLRKVYYKYRYSRNNWLKQLNDLKAIERYGTDDKNISELEHSDNNLKGNSFSIEVLNKEKVAYLAIDSMNSMNVENDMKTIGIFLRSIVNSSALIIDIRGNGGGDSTYWIKIVEMLIDRPLYYKEYTLYRGGKFEENFIEEALKLKYSQLKKVSGIDGEHLNNLPAEVKQDFKYYHVNNVIVFPKDSIKYRGKIFLLVDRVVFSSAENFAAFSKSTGFAKVVGEKTSGDGVGFDPILCVLPKSGYIFTFPGEMELNADGSSNFEKGTEPDIKLPVEKSNNIYYDKAIKSILQILNKQNI